MSTPRLEIPDYTTPADVTLELTHSQATSMFIALAKGYAEVQQRRDRFRQYDADGFEPHGTTTWAGMIASSDAYLSDIEAVVAQLPTHLREMWPTQVAQAVTR